MFPTIFNFCPAWNWHIVDICVNNRLNWEKFTDTSDIPTFYSLILHFEYKNFWIYWRTNRGYLYTKNPLFYFHFSFLFDVQTVYPQGVIFRQFWYEKLEKENTKEDIKMPISYRKCIDHVTQFVLFLESFLCNGKFKVKPNMIELMRNLDGLIFSAPPYLSMHH